MGIHDRDYIRDESPRRRPGPGGGRPRFSAWSITTWLIVINVAVYVIDGFLPPVFTEAGPVRIAAAFQEQVAQLDKSVLIEGRVQAIEQNGRIVDYARPISVDTAEGRVVVGSQKMRPTAPLRKYLHFSTAKGFLQVQFWRFVGFQFLHADLTHLLFNMIGLYFLGPLAEQYLGRKRYLAFYLLCGIAGALMYTLLNLGGWLVTSMGGGSVPVWLNWLLFGDLETPLIGASAGVFGAIMAGAYLAPNAMVLLFFIIPMRLVTLAYGLVAVAIFTLVTSGSNAGGEAGHLGGAIAGFYFIRHPKHLHGFFDFVGWIDPTSHHYRGNKKAKRKLPKSAPGRDEVDRILDKISEKGLQSLTDREKRILRESSED